VTPSGSVRRWYRLPGASSGRLRSRRGPGGDGACKRTPTALALGAEVIGRHADLDAAVAHPQAQPGAAPGAPGPPTARADTQRAGLGAGATGSPTAGRIPRAAKAGPHP
jgi:hypothetical protein